MTIAQKLGMGIIGLAVITTLILPGRQTVPVVNAFGSFSQGLIGTAMGTK